MLYNLLIFIGICPLPFMMNGEIFPEECKSAASGLSTATAWLTAFIVSKTVVNLQAVLGYSGTYFLYGSLCTLGTVYIIFGVPETKGKTPEEILDYFSISKKEKKIENNLEGNWIGLKSHDNHAFAVSHLQDESPSARSS